MIESLFQPRKLTFNLVAAMTVIAAFSCYHTLVIIPSLLNQILFKGLFWLFMLNAVCAYFPWYGKAHKGRGIEYHMERIFIPMVYFFYISNILQLTGLTHWLFFLFLIFLFLFGLATNTILLYFHFTDNDKTPPEFYAKK